MGSRPARPVAPEVAQAEQAAHTEAVACFAEILGVPDDDALVEASSSLSLARRYCLAQMAADLWRQLLRLPHYNVENTKAIITTLGGKFE